MKVPSINVEVHQEVDEVMNWKSDQIVSEEEKARYWIVKLGCYIKDKWGREEGNLEMTRLNDGPTRWVKEEEQRRWKKKKKN